MTYYNEHIDDLGEGDFNKFEEQLQREEDFEEYCNKMQNLHEYMIDYISKSNNNNLMQYSDYFDLMNLIEKEEYQFTIEEKKLFTYPKKKK